MEVPDYEDKVPEAVRNSNAAKLTSYEGEISALREALEKFSKMKM